MRSKAMVMLNFISPRAKTSGSLFFKFRQTSLSFPSLSRRLHDHCSSKNHQTIRNFSSDKSGLDPPDVAHLAETARISLTPDEVQEFGPKIKEVINWFGQLQEVDLESIEPAIRADTEADNIRDDLPEPFANRESIIAALPSYDEPYVKVPKVLNKE